MSANENQEKVKNHPNFIKDFSLIPGYSELKEQADLNSLFVKFRHAQDTIDKAEKEIKREEELIAKEKRELQSLNEQLASKLASINTTIKKKQDSLQTIQTKIQELNKQYPNKRDPTYIANLTRFKKWETNFNDELGKLTKERDLLSHNEESTALKRKVGAVTLKISTAIEKRREALEIQNQYSKLFGEWAEMKYFIVPGVGKDKDNFYVYSNLGDKDHLLRHRKIKIQDDGFRIEVTQELKPKQNKFVLNKDLTGCIEEWLKELERSRRLSPPARDSTPSPTPTSKRLKPAG